MMNCGGQKIEAYWTFKERVWTAVFWSLLLLTIVSFFFIPFAILIGCPISLTTGYLLVRGMKDQAVYTCKQLGCMTCWNEEHGSDEEEVKEQ